MVLNEQQQDVVLLDPIPPLAGRRAQLRTVSRAGRQPRRPLWPGVLVAGAWVPVGLVLLAMTLAHTASQADLWLFLLGFCLSPLGIVCGLAGIAFVGRHLNGAVLLSSVLAFLIDMGLLAWASRLPIGP